MYDNVGSTNSRMQIFTCQIAQVPWTRTGVFHYLHLFWCLVIRLNTFKPQKMTIIDERTELR